MRAGISEPTRPDTARHSHCHLSVTTGPFSVSVLGPDEFSRLAAPTQVVVDLMTGPGRSPNEAEELLEWMKRNERSWRN